MFEATKTETTHCVRSFSQSSSAMDQVKIFEDPTNWKQNRLPCKADRIVFPDTASVIINSSVSAREIILPNNGAIIFGENAKIELYESSADASCPGEDILFTGEGSSHWTSVDTSYSTGQIMFNALIVVIVCALAYAVYMNQVQGVAVNQMITNVTTTFHRVSGRFANLYVQQPPEGTFNFVRFQGDDDNIELELGSHPILPPVVTQVSGSSENNGVSNTDRADELRGSTKQARSLRGIGYLMSDIEEVEEEEESPDREMDDSQTTETEYASVGDDSDKRLLLDEE
jgi:hypothetical protein